MAEPGCKPLTLRPWLPLALILVAMLAMACSNASTPDDARTTTSDIESTTTVAPIADAEPTAQEAWWEEFLGDIDETLPGFVASPPSEPWVEGTLEFWEWIASCAGENGEAVQTNRYRSSPALGTQDGTLRTRRVVAACWRVSLDSGWVIPTPFDGSAEGNRMLYSVWVAVYDCLVENEYPTVPPPSEDVFVERGAVSWNPYAGMPGFGLPVIALPHSQLSDRDRRQLVAQELCGATAEVIYQEELRSDS